jgi:type III secretion system YscI/HrpB-like protein
LIETKLLASVVPGEADAATAATPGNADFGKGPQPGADDIARFENLLASSASSLGDSTGESLASQISQLEQGQADKLRELESLFSNADEEMSAGNMLRVQQNLLTITLTFDLSAKTISQTTQNIDQLTRMQ